MSQAKITKEDIKNKFQGLEDGISKAKLSAAPAIPLLVVGASAVLFVIGLYLGFGLGKKRNALIEIKRI